MLLDFLTNDLYTDDGKFIKKLSCPVDISWEDLADSASNPKARICSECSRDVVDTEFLSDDEALILVQENPNTCFKIAPDQFNLKLTANEYFR